jgi:predicted metal-dependent hydrolase
VTATPPLDLFLAAIDAGKHFEAHEILEEYWVQYRGADRDFYKGLIQAAVALHHAAHANRAGASAVARRAAEHLRPFAPRHAAVDVAAILERLSREAS